MLDCPEILCDECDNWIPKQSWKCRQCGYDSCWKCFPTVRVVHANKHQQPVEWEHNLHNDPKIWGIRYCDSCFRWLQENSWKCVQCEHDVCTSCFESERISHVHEQALEWEVVHHVDPYTKWWNSESRTTLFQPEDTSAE